MWIELLFTGTIITSLMDGYRVLLSALKQFHMFKLVDPFSIEV